MLLAVPPCAFNAVTLHVQTTAASQLLSYYAV